MIFYFLSMKGENIVAGARFERASSGYEPDEIPLLHPAMDLIITQNKNYARY